MNIEGDVKRKVLVKQRPPGRPHSSELNQEIEGM